MSLARHTAGLAALALVAGALVATGGATAAYAADAVAGGQTSGDTLFPNQGNSGYDALHYDINFAVDVTISSTNNGASTTNLPDATASITAKTTGAPLSSYSFDFQGTTSTLAAATLNVDSVAVNGVPATFSRIENTTTSNEKTDKHKLIVTPATPVDGEFVTVIKYSGKPVIHTDTDNSLEGWNNTVDGATFVNQPIGSMTLFPNNNTPSDKATYKFTVNAPSTLRTSNFAQAGGKAYQAAVVSNGELTSRTESADGSRTTWVWEQQKPMASELSLISVGRYDIYTSNITLASGRTIPEWTFIDPAISTANQAQTLATRAQLKQTLDFFESKFGPYPGNSTGLVTDNTTGINYALETQDRPFFPNSASRGTTYHELMHQWWGNAVAPADWNDIWLNEGPAQYSEYQFPYEGAGSSTTTTEQQNFALYTARAATSATFSTPVAAMTAADQLFGNQVYERGSITLEALRTSIGTQAFATVMSQWQSRYTGKSKTTADFIALAEEISGRNLTAFFTTWLYTTGKPAWPSKFNFSVAGPTSQVNAGDAVTYTLSARNTGKVAMPASGSVITVDVADLLDDATIGALPTGVTLDGTTLTWTVPATALAATSTVAIPATVNASATGTLKAIARAATLGGTAVDSTSSVAIGAAPISAAPVPTITGGTPTVGSPLTADTTGWAADASLAYQWFIDGTPVPGATSATFTPTLDVVGLAVTVKVTGTRAGDLATAKTSAATPVGVRSAQPVAVPTISGTPKIGSTLTVDPGTWLDGTVFTYVWAANGTTIAGATGARYTPAVATQVGQTITVAVQGTKSGYTTVTRTSASTAAVAAGDPLVLTPTPTLPATPKVGTPLTAVPGDWDTGVTLTYTWQANGTNITGATAVAFTPTATQLGQPLTVTVIGTKPGMTAVSRVSAPSTVEVGTQVLQPAPTITDTPRAGTSAVGVQGTWDTNTTKTNKWYADGVEIAGATATSYTPTIAQIGQVLTYEVTSTRAGYTTVTKTSAGKTIVGLAQTLTPTPVISGTAKFPNTLTVAPGTWDADTTLTQQWFAGGTAIDGATGLDYTLAPADIGKTITVTVTSVKPTYETTSRTSEATAAVAEGDLELTPTPTISGTPKVGVELTAAPGTWDAGVALSYQWSDSDGEIAGATAVTYTPAANKAGESITVAVTGTKSGYTSATKTSEPTAEVALGDLAVTPVPTISGTAKVDVELAAVSGTWTEGTALSFQWFADDEALDGETGTTFTPGVDLVGATITVSVTGTKDGYTPVTKTSDATDEVAEGDFVLAPVPTITGASQVDVTLTVEPGAWDAGTELAYQWYLDGDAVDGATGLAFTPLAADAGSVVTVKVTGTKDGYESVTKTSEESSAVADGELVDTPVPTISGTAKVDVELTAVAGDWDAGTELAFQWFVGDEAVADAVETTYTPSVADFGSEITVSVTGTKDGYVTVTKTSAPTAPVALGDLVLTPQPKIQGSVQVGKPLTAVGGTWDAGTALAYQWLRDGVEISGATAATYTLRAADHAHKVSVAVTGSKAGYRSITTTSVDKTVAIGAQKLHPKVTIKGTAKVGNTLTAKPGAYDSGVTKSYTWYANGKKIGTNKITIKLLSKYEGKRITVKVTAKKTGYATLNSVSAKTAKVK